MSVDTTRSNYSRRFTWLATAIVLAIAAYTGGWYYVAGMVQDESSKAIASVNRDGIRLDCDNREVKGYPFRLGLNCDRVLLKHESGGLTFSAGAFRSAAQVYDPAFLISELDGTAKLDVPGLPSFSFDWEILRSSVRLASPLPTRLSVEARKLGAAINADSASIRNLFTADHIEAHLRPNDAELDFAASFNGLLFDRSLLEGRKLPSLNGGIDVAIVDGVRLATSPRISLRGQSGMLRDAYLSPGDVGVIRATGHFTVNMAGLVDAQMAIRVQGVRALADIAADSFPESAGEIESFAASLEALGENAELPVHVVKGKISYGFVDLGEIPPLP